MYVFVKPIPARDPAVDVMVMGSPRENPAIKDTKWIVYVIIGIIIMYRQRTEYERAKPVTAEEVILHKGDAMYEGLSSNMFVLTHDDVVVTAPVQYVLHGTVMKVVDSICSKRNFKLEYRLPTIPELRTCHGAFITSMYCAM